MNRRPKSGGGILITEDNRPTSELLETLLVKALPGYRIRIAASAEDALELCREEPPELVIMDISLPGMNGIEATRRIKATLPDVPVVMHSNLDAPIYARECEKAGAAAFV
jgi:two-component system invasion response regulator UvrY